jgi:hypothetical protein
LEQQRGFHEKSFVLPPSGSIQRKLPDLDEAICELKEFHASIALQRPNLGFPAPRRILASLCPSLVSVEAESQKLIKLEVKYDGIRFIYLIHMRLYIAQSLINVIQCL